mmetsp:Transcript_22587/g.58972  ORF Transcript_22587/g.58972 Transcript_22587/m.58972 type:complete len:220 (-) Transcript_22587:63-722(-)
MYKKINVQMPLLHDYSEISPYSTHNNRVAKSGKEVRLACFITMQEVSTGVVRVATGHQFAPRRLLGLLLSLQLGHLVGFLLCVGTLQPRSAPHHHCCLERHALVLQLQGQIVVDASHDLSPHFQDLAQGNRTRVSAQGFQQLWLGIDLFHGFCCCHDRILGVVLLQRLTYTTHKNIPLCHCSCKGAEAKECKQKCFARRLLHTAGWNFRLWLKKFVVLR